MSKKKPEPAANTVLRVAVLGDGSFGTCLAVLLAKNGHQVRLWSAFSEQSAALARDRENKRYLPGVPLHPNVHPVADTFAACDGCDLVVSVVPTQYLRAVAERFEAAIAGRTPLVSATKGLEIETFSRPSEVLREVLGERPIGVLTGPSHAEEVAIGMPASVVVASTDAAFAELVQRTFSGDTFRVYTSSDPIGAELGGALKNVIAIAAGISDGLGLGDNSKAALMTRGMLELARYGVREGARAETFFGLAGVGDLITTCCSKHSRNRSVGERIGRGATLQEVLESMHMVAEGVWTTRALFGPESEARASDLPIASQVHAVLFENKNPRQAVADLMQREPVAEMEGLLPGFGA